MINVGGAMDAAIEYGSDAVGMAAQQGVGSSSRSALFPELAKDAYNSMFKNKALKNLLTKRELVNTTGDSGSTFYSTRTFSKILDTVNECHKIDDSTKYKEALNRFNKLESLISTWQKIPDTDKQAVIDKKREVLAELQQQVDQYISRFEALVKAYS